MLRWGSPQMHSQNFSSHPLLPSCSSGTGLAQPGNGPKVCSITAGIFQDRRASLHKRPKLALWELLRAPQGGWEGLINKYIGKNVDCANSNDLNKEEMGKAPFKKKCKTLRNWTKNYQIKSTLRQSCAKMEKMHEWCPPLGVMSAEQKPKTRLGLRETNARVIKRILYYFPIVTVKNCHKLHGLK